MNTIPGINDILRLLQSRSAKTKELGKIDRSTKATPDKNINEYVFRKIDQEDLIEKIEKRVQALPKDSRSPKEVTSIVVDSILTWQLGEEIFRDPKFTEIARDVKANISSDEKAREKLLSMFKL